MKRISALFDKLKQWWRFSRCYNRMEGKGIAVFSMCCGNGLEEQRRQCVQCPYFTPLR